MQVVRSTPMFAPRFIHTTLSYARLFHTVLQSEGLRAAAKPTRQLKKLPKSWTLNPRASSTPTYAEYQHSLDHLSFIIK